MKQIVKILSFIAIVVIALNSCKSGSSDKDAKADSLKKEAMDSTKTKTEGQEYSAKYVCPMHCKGSGGDKPGNCPECEMTYIENPNPKQ